MTHALPLALACKLCSLCVLMSPFSSLSIAATYGTDSREPDLLPMPEINKLLPNFDRDHP